MKSRLEIRRTPRKADEISYFKFLIIILIVLVIFIIVFRSIKTKKFLQNFLFKTTDPKGFPKNLKNQDKNTDKLVPVSRPKNLKNQDKNTDKLVPVSKINLEYSKVLILNRDNTIRLISKKEDLKDGSTTQIRSWYQDPTSFRILPDLEKGLKLLNANSKDKNLKDYIFYVGYITNHNLDLNNTFINVKTEKIGSPYTILCHSHNLKIPLTQVNPFSNKLKIKIENFIMNAENLYEKIHTLDGGFLDLKSEGVNLEIHLLKIEKYSDFYTFEKSDNLFKSSCSNRDYQNLIALTKPYVPATYKTNLILNNTLSIFYYKCTVKNNTSL